MQIGVSWCMGNSHHRELVLRATYLPTRVVINDHQPKQITVIREGGVYGCVYMFLEGLERRRKDDDGQGTC